MAAAEGTPGAGVVVVRGASRREASRADRLRSAIGQAGLATEVLGDGGASADAVRDAVGRLAGRCGGAWARIGVLAAGRDADAAVQGAAADGRVRAFAFLSGRLGRDAKERLAEWRDAAVLCVAGAGERSALRDMTDAYLLSRSPDADLRVLGDGRPAPAREREPLERSVATWLRDVLAPDRREREVSFTTEDGWEIHGALSVPGTGPPAPGVVLLHSGRTDRHVFGSFARLLERRGFAVLAVDWRGRGQSTGKGTYLALSAEERARGGLDAKAAVACLAAEEGVDPDRVGIVGIVHGAEYAVRGSIGDPRVRALVLLTGYMPASDEERAHLVSGGVHVFAVSSAGHGPVNDAMRSLYEATPDKLARLLVYPGGAIGYQLFTLDERLGETIAAWLAEALA